MSNTQAVRALLVKAAVLVILPVAAAAAAVSPMLLPALRSISPLKYQLLLAVEYGQAIRVAAIGDSHAAMGFRPAVAGAFSLAFPGENIYESAAKFEALLDRLPDLRAVAIQAQPHIFFAHRQSQPRAEYLHLKPLIDSPLPTLLKDPCCRGSLPGAALRAAIGIPLNRAVPTIERSGYAFYPKHVTLDFLQQARHEVASYGTVTPVPALRRQYGELIAQLRQRRVDIVLTRYPLTVAYRSVLSPAVLTEAETFFASLERELQLKACGDWDAIQDDSLFFNADHLSPEGASVYWRMLEPCFASYLRS